MTNTAPTLLNSLTSDDSRVKEKTRNIILRNITAEENIKNFSHNFERFLEFFKHNEIYNVEVNILIEASIEHLLTKIIKRKTPQDLALIDEDAFEKVLIDLEDFLNFAEKRDEQLFRQLVDGNAYPNTAKLWRENTARILSDRRGQDELMAGSVRTAEETEDPTLAAEEPLPIDDSAREREAYRSQEVKKLLDSLDDLHSRLEHAQKQEDVDLLTELEELLFYYHNLSLTPGSEEDKAFIVKVWRILRERYPERKQVTKADILRHPLVKRFVDENNRSIGDKTGSDMTLAEQEANTKVKEAITHQDELRQPVTIEDSTESTEESIPQPLSHRPHNFALEFYKDPSSLEDGVTKMLEELKNLALESIDYENLLDMFDNLLVSYEKLLTWMRTDKSAGGVEQQRLVRVIDMLKAIWGIVSTVRPSGDSYIRFWRVRNFLRENGLIDNLVEERKDEPDGEEKPYPGVPLSSKAKLPIPSPFSTTDDFEDLDYANLDNSGDQMTPQQRLDLILFGNGTIIRGMWEIIIHKQAAAEELWAAAGDRIVELERERKSAQDIGMETNYLKLSLQIRKLEKLRDALKKKSILALRFIFRLAAERTDVDEEVDVYELEKQTLAERYERTLEGIRGELGPALQLKYLEDAKLILLKDTSVQPLFQYLHENNLLEDLTSEIVNLVVSFNYLTLSNHSFQRIEALLDLIVTIYESDDVIGDGSDRKLKSIFDQGRKQALGDQFILVLEYLNGKNGAILTRATQVFRKLYRNNELIKIIPEQSRQEICKLILDNLIIDGKTNADVLELMLDMQNEQSSSELRTLFIKYLVDLPFDGKMNLWTNVILPEIENGFQGRTMSESVLSWLRDVLKQDPEFEAAVFQIEYQKEQDKVLSVESTFTTILDDVMARDKEEEVESRVEEKLGNRRFLGQQWDKKFRPNKRSKMMEKFGAEFEQEVNQSLNDGLTRLLESLNNDASNVIDALASNDVMEKFIAVIERVIILYRAEGFSAEIKSKATKILRMVFFDAELLGALPNEMRVAQLEAWMDDLRIYRERGIEVLEFENELENKVAEKRARKGRKVAKRAQRKYMGILAQKFDYMMQPQNGVIKDLTTILENPQLFELYREVPTLNKVLVELLRGMVHSKDGLKEYIPFLMLLLDSFEIRDFLSSEVKGILGEVILTGLAEGLKEYKQILYSIVMGTAIDGDEMIDTLAAALRAAPDELRRKLYGEPGELEAKYYGWKNFIARNIRPNAYKEDMRFVRALRVIVDPAQNSPDGSDIDIEAQNIDIDRRNEVLIQSTMERINQLVSAEDAKSQISSQIDYIESLFVEPGEFLKNLADPELDLNIEHINNIARLFELLVDMLVNLSDSNVQANSIMSDRVVEVIKKFSEQGVPWALQGRVTHRLDKYTLHMLKKNKLPDRSEARRKVRSVRKLLKFDPDKNYKDNNILTTLDTLGMVVAAYDDKKMSAVLVKEFYLKYIRWNNTDFLTTLAKLDPNKPEDKADYKLVQRFIEKIIKMYVSAARRDPAQYQLLSKILTSLNDILPDGYFAGSINYFEAAVLSEERKGEEQYDQTLSAPVRMEFTALRSKIEAKAFIF